MIHIKTTDGSAIVLLLLQCRYYILFPTILQTHNIQSKKAFHKIRGKKTIFIIHNNSFHPTPHNIISYRYNITKNKPYNNM